MSRRDQIRMSPDELAAYLDEQKVINVATIGPNGRPHLAPLWYYPHESGVATWTYGTSQKAKNLERDPRATVLIEDGESYEKLRGVSLEADVEIVTDTAAVTQMGISLMQRYAGAKPGDPVPDELSGFIGKQAPKRIGLIFRPTKIVSWDHTKLGGAY
ncbi:pyridoxamine 5'-phosphate oxidase family protein [Amycolatopsis roodepoortensis]|uniref:PPOX class probable F420-dependent enzyme n=1 Tax=Amycolatopsis roodepoortensis TaxID=700274 RepID=A0ABR9LJ22_9PSEU|nr:pyridoxamine 5'-phosphate oxidase family protein [Amycolatopsis roodepoortensis]MBE1580567.1 PPOX class probable F420-dependent enzyme [Amycolatopsis roodepoortensis]UUV27949.1 pyridoxamine 5'-phosphate oxidase family protein [Amycolatopsis roodepoortensis]